MDPTYISVVGYSYSLLTETFTFMCSEEVSGLELGLIREHLQMLALPFLQVEG